MTDLRSGEHRQVVRGPARLAWLVGGAGALLLVAVGLYASGVSRAVGVVLFTIGGAALLAAATVRIRGSWPRRIWFVIVAVLLALLVVYGVAIWVYALTTPVTAA